MQISDELVIELLFDRLADGRFYIHSPSVPGLHLAGPDLAALRADIEPAVKRLLWESTSTSEATGSRSGGPGWRASDPATRPSDLK